MNFHLVIFGFGVGLVINDFDVSQSRWIILSWSIVAHHRIWRSETHTRSVESGYHYRCVKNGETVEAFSFHSPIVRDRL